MNLTSAKDVAAENGGAQPAGAADAQPSGGNGKRPDAAMWADLPHREIETLIENSRERGWRAALDEVEPRAPVFAKRMRNIGLGNWHVLLGKHPSGRSLDVGSGFGSLVLGLSQHFENAFGLEFLEERVAYSVVRAEEEQFANSRFVRGSGHALPFRDGACSLVTLNGVLEWAGLYADREPADAVQVGMLEEARRVAGGGGYVAVAIENRFALESLLAMRDTHTGLHFVTALPRWAANAVSRLRTGRPYRTYLYGHRGYRSLFRRAGFRECRVLDLVSSYNDYDFVFDTLDVASYRFVYDHGLVRPFFGAAGSARNVVRRTVPSALGKLSYAYLVVGGDEVSLMLDTDHPIWTDARRLGIDGGHARFACNGSGVGCMALVCHDGGRVTGMLEVGKQLLAHESPPTVLPQEIVRACAGHLGYAGAFTTNGVGVRAYRPSA